MKIDPSQSRFHEHPGAVQEFNTTELRKLRLLLRRLRFLETKVRENGGLANSSGSGGSAFAEWEADALEWILLDVGFIKTPAPAPFPGVTK